MPKDTALDLIGVTTCCERCGDVSDNVALSEKDDEFKDWHSRVNVGSKCFNLLCCPEDLQCKNIMTERHSRQECCEACEMPCCQECAHHIFAEEPGMSPAALANDMMIYYAPT